MDRKIEEILKHIRFRERFLDICVKHPHFERRMQSFEKRKILEILSLYSPEFKYSEKVFFLKEETDNVHWHLVLNIKRGIYLPYINVKVDEEYLDIASGNFGVVAYTLEGEETSVSNMPIYTSYDEFREVSDGILLLYNDIKNEFYKLVSSY
jgi:hypothetical protein